MKNSGIIILLLSLFAAVGGCSGTWDSASTDSSSSSDGTTTVTISLGRTSSDGSLGNEKLSAAAIPSNVAQISISVTAADMTAMATTVAIPASGDISADLEIPNGADRKVVVKALDASSSTLYAGTETVDLDGTAIELTVAMRTAISLSGSLTTDATWKGIASPADDGWSGGSEFDDSAWGSSAAKTACDSLADYRITSSSGDLIWLGDPAATEGYFRKTFVIDGAPAYAEINVISFDDYELYVNGVFVASTSDGGPGYPPDTYDITSLLLADEENTVAIAASSTLSTEDSCQGIYTQVAFTESGESTPLEGIWAAAHISRDNQSGEWRTDLTKVALFYDGTGKYEEQSNDSATGYSSDSGEFTYTDVENSDGSRSLTIYPLAGTPGESETHIMYIANNRSMAIENSVGNTSQTQLMYMVKLLPSDLYSDDMFAGTYTVGTYSYNNDSSNQSYSSSTSQFTTAATGTFTIVGSSNKDGVVSGDGTYNGTCDLMLDGSFSLDSAGLGWLGGNGTVAAIAPQLKAAAPAPMELGFAMKQEAGQRYSTSDLAGQWYFAGFGDQTGSAYLSSFGTISCVPSGTCSRNYTINLDGTMIQRTDFLTGLSVRTDGAFGNFLNPGYPTSAVIGNRKSTLLIMGSFENGTDFRQIVIAVKPLR